MTLIQTKKLSKRFGALTALEELDLKIGAGEVYALIGPNGSGKTTTVKLLAGLLQPAGGEVFLNGVSLFREPEQAKTAIALVPDDPFVYEKMSGREFLHFVGTLYGVMEQDRIRSVEKLLPAFPGLADVIDGFVENYSRGNKQKLTFIAALLHEPKILLIDEPMVGLDPESAVTVKKLLKDFSAGGGAVLVATHTLAVAEDIATRIGILAGGKLIEEGTLEALTAKAGKPSARLEELYLYFTRRA